MTTTPARPLNDWLDQAHVITYIYLLYAIGGLIITITHPDTLSFGDYTTRLVAFGAAIGLARGFKAGKRQEGVGRAAQGGATNPADVVK